MSITFPGESAEYRAARGTSPQKDAQPTGTSS
jgi:hypothetical protein